MISAGGLDGGQAASHSPHGRRLPRAAAVEGEALGDGAAERVGCEGAEHAVGDAVGDALEVGRDGEGWRRLAFGTMDWGGDLELGTST